MISAPDQAESAALSAALQSAFERLGGSDGRLQITIVDYRAQSIQGDVAAIVTLGPILAPALGARTPVWYGVTHLRAVLRDPTARSWAVGT